MSLSPIGQFDVPESVPPPFETHFVPPPARERRMPNIGHAAIFFAFAAMLLLLLQLGLMVLGLAPVKGAGDVVTIQHPLLQLGVMAWTYAGTLAAAWLFFPLVWQRPFFAGVRWRWSAARALALWLLGLGLLLGFTIAFLDQFIQQPKTPEIDQFFGTQLSAWIVTVFGIFVAPTFEEIAFRGMLLPAFAISFDWMRMPRTAEGYRKWRSGTAISLPGWVVSAVLTSILFTWLHAQQVGYSRGVLAALFCVSLVLTIVRLRFDSVAASTMVHAAYNGFIFLAGLIATGGYRHLDRMTH